MIISITIKLKKKITNEMQYINAILNLNENFSLSLFFKLSKN